MSRTVLVTGAAGFIGLQLAAQCLAGFWQHKGTQEKTTRDEQPAGHEQCGNAAQQERPLGFFLLWSGSRCVCHES